MGNQGDKWCILRTAGARTLALAASLNDAGMTAWTPVAIRRQGIRRGAEIVEVERPRPIAPTFVFGAESQLLDFAILAAQPFSAHPSFSVFQWDGRYPIVGARGLSGLREAEAVARVAIEVKREDLARERRQRERAAALRTEKQKRKALKSVRRDFELGTRVEVMDMPAMAGVTGTIVESRGTSAVIAFGGSLNMTIEAWKIIPHDVVRGSLLTA